MKIEILRTNKEEGYVCHICLKPKKDILHIYTDNSKEELYVCFKCLKKCLKKGRFKLHKWIR